MADKIGKKKYDFFAVDFNEELSGLSGSLLNRQTDFTSSCVGHILALYKGRHSSLVIVGHSMGGVIARALFSLVNFDQSTISIVITQATPHLRPFFLLDVAMKQYYERTNEAWRNMSDKIYMDILDGKDPPRVTLVSAGGGDRDHVVRTELTSLSWIGSHHHAIWTSSVSMPKVWVSTDHLCHVWCKQVVMATVRALYDVIDPITKQVSTNSSLRYEVMKYHFLTNHGNTFLTPPPRTLLVNHKFKWEFIKAPWSHLGRNPYSRNVVIDLSQINQNSEIIIMSNIEISDWIGICTPNITTKTCSHLDPLSSHVNLLPKSPGLYKVIHLNYEQLRSQQYLVMVLPSSTHPIAFVDVFEPVERSLTIDFGLLSSSSSSSSPPSSSSSSSSSSLWFWKNHELIMSGPAYYSVEFMDLSHLDVYEVKVTNQHCEGGNEASSVMMFEDERGEYPTYSIIRNGQTNTMIVKLTSRSMKIPMKLKDMLPVIPRPKLKLFLTSGCTFKVEIYPSMSGMLGQVVRFYLPHLPAIMSVALLLRLGGQYSKIGSFLTHVIPVVVFALVTIAINSVGLDQLIKRRHDLSTFEQSDWLVTFGLYLLSSSITLLLAAATDLSCSIISGFLYRLTKLSQRIRSCIDLLSRLIFIFLFTFPVVSVVSCGSVVLLIVHMTYFAMVVGRKLNQRMNPRPIKTLSASSCTLTFLVNFLQFMLNFPVLIFWFKDIRSFHLLDDDPSFVHSCVSGVVLCWFCYLQRHGYLERLSEYKSNFIWVATILISTLIILYGSITMYMISYFIDAFLTLLALHSFALMSSKKMNSSGLDLMGTNNLDNDQCLLDDDNGGDDGGDGDSGDGVDNDDDDDIVKMTVVLKSQCKKEI